MVPLNDRRNDRDDESSLRVPGGGQWSSAHACDRHFDEAMEPPARHTNDDGSRTTSRALVGSETPEEEEEEKRKKKKRIRKKTRSRRSSGEEEKSGRKIYSLTNFVWNKLKRLGIQPPRLQEKRGRNLSLGAKNKEQAIFVRYREWTKRTGCLQRSLKLLNTRTVPPAVVLPMLASNIAPI